jgi:hypothetical protein
VVVLTAGDTGAGKTTALRASPRLAENAQYIDDSNLSSKKSSVQKIGAAKAAGNRVEIVFAHREPVGALTGGVLPRAMQEGRVVGLDAHARMYRDAAENLAYLMRKYSGDPNVHFRAVDKTGGVGQTRMMPLEEAGKIRYSPNELAPQLRAALEKEYAAGTISKAVYRATLRSSSPGTPRGVERHPGPGDPPAGVSGDVGGRPR